MTVALVIGCLAVAVIGYVLSLRDERWLGGLTATLGVVLLVLCVMLLWRIDGLQDALAAAPPPERLDELATARQDLAGARDECAELQQRFEREREARELAEERLIAEMMPPEPEPAAVEPPAQDEALPLPAADKPASTPPPSSDNYRERRLTTGGNEQVPVCVTRDAYEEFIQAAGRGDTHGAVNLTLAGLIFFVDNNTRVLMLDSTWGSQQVRILSGPQTGLSGWVPSEWVVK